MNLTTFMRQLKDKNPHQPEFHQAVHEVAGTLLPFIKHNTAYQEARILERLCEPDRVVMFRVCWQDDQGAFQLNRGYRVQFCNAIGPYKGGLRFDPSVNLSILKFLGFEQIFKNSLTTLPLGGAKGGSDFNPKGKSDGEVMRFCQAFMTELHRYIGPDVDVPAGDIGVGAREIGYLFGQYKRLAGQFNGVLTGKQLSYGGSLIRPEATGYGCAYMAQEVLRQRDDELEGKHCVLSGSGNVAQYAAEKLISRGAKVVTLSDRTGFIHVPEGLTREQLAFIMEHKNDHRGDLSACPDAFSCTYHPDEKPWRIQCDLAFPCATQNELDHRDAELLQEQGCQLVCEGANMPTTEKAIKLLQSSGVTFVPGKAANAGGVAVSGLEMTQNSQRLPWTQQQVDDKLHEIMESIHQKCVEYGKKEDSINYVKGANVAGFVKVANALLAQGCF